MARNVQPLKGARLEALLERLPAKPGVYLMKGLRGSVIYIGKAKNLRSRVRSYFRASGDERAFVARLDCELGEIEVIVTSSEKDALILERELIGKKRPRYNVDLTDDKNFLSIRITSSQPYPRLVLDRRRPRGDPQADGGGRWFGPYTSATAARETFRLLQTAFGLRTCNDTSFRGRQRPCLLQQMGRCLGPCALEVPPDEYALHIKQAVSLLSGRSDDVIEALRDKMRAAAAELRFEDAARLRDRIAAVSGALDRKTLIDPSRKDRDAIGIHREGAAGVIVILHVRRGWLLGISRFPFSDSQAPTADLVRQIFTRHYGSGAEVPPEIFLPPEASLGAEGDGDLDLLCEFLCERRKGIVELFAPRRGTAELIGLARENAREAFLSRLATTGILMNRLERLERRLHLAHLPRRIDCFDLSTLGGHWSVGSMAVLVDGEPAPAEYRRYRIRDAAPDSDVDMMREVISRRFRSILDGKVDGPDLVLLDGGLGQLRAVRAVFEDLGVTDVGLAALAKGRAEKKKGKRSREKVYLPGRKNPILLRPDSDELFLLARVRDEAHRFAVAYHRRLRRKSKLRSVLDEVPGVGPVLRRRLLVHFGSLRGVRAAVPGRLTEVKGVTPRLALRIHNFLCDLTDLGGTDSGT
ncbi:MAG TPA: excinuclease ABC subunit UvrC [Myxococcota bacterium]|nr:excinuclease ABC subunit UvrC [Myxococcota bacterium]